MAAFSQPLLRYSLLLLLIFADSNMTFAKEAKSLGDVERQFFDTEAQLMALDSEIVKSQAIKKLLERALNEVQTQVGEREQRLRGLDEDIMRFNLTLNSLDAHVAEAQKEVAARQSVLAKTLRETQVMGKQTALKIILQNDNPATADRLSVYTDYMLTAQRNAIDQQVTVLQRIRKAQAIALKNRNWLNYIKNKAKKQQENYANKATEKKRSLGKIDAELSDKTRTVAELKADQERLQSLMQELKKLQTAPSGYFESGKGRYAAPVQGSINARFGEIKSVGKLRWSGLFIIANDGLPVLAVADGEVIYSDWLRGFGMLVIIDHGDNYTSLYGGNRTVSVPAGQWVESGATIATVGDSGGQSVSGVYFEIRHNAQALDPEPWLNLDSVSQSVR